MVGDTENEAKHSELLCYEERSILRLSAFHLFICRNSFVILSKVIFLGLFLAILRLHVFSFLGG